MTPVPIVIQFWHRIAAATVHRQEFVRSLQRLVGIVLPTVGKNIIALMGITSSALLPPNGYVAPALHQLHRTLRQKKTLVPIAVGLIGLAVFLPILVISVRREPAKEGTNAAIDSLPAAFTSPHQIEFAERFAIEPRSPIPLEAVNLSSTSGVTPFSDDVQTFGQASREPVPLPRPRRHR